MKGGPLLDGTMQANGRRRLSLSLMQMEMPKVPRAFIKRGKVKLILCHIAEDFGHEEQQALYFYCFLDVPIDEIAEKVGLSQSHVASVLVLYSERLTDKLNLFKRAILYDANDLLPVSEILLQYNIKDGA
jgi:hypothetical protein